ncbi:hypothetical protein M1Y69_003501 [Salmonella enterica]|nr:hypothetical protein [Salmonella enterica]
MMKTFGDFLTEWDGLATDNKEIVEFVEKRGDKWVVFDHTKTKVLGTHDTKADADAQLRAIEANKNK